MHGGSLIHDVSTFDDGTNPIYLTQLLEIFSKIDE